jgi:chromosome segregation ATPase
MPIDQADLHDYGLPDPLINRLCAQFGASIPEPPLAMKDFDQVGVYHAISEFYAMKLLLAQDVHPAVAKVRALIGGTTKTVSDNIRTLRAELPKETFARSTAVAGDDTLATLKRELVRAEREMFDIELSEADQRHTDEMVRTELSHEKRVTELEARLNAAIGHNKGMQQHLDAQKIENETLYEKLKAEAVKQNTLEDALTLNDHLRTELADSKETKKKLFAVNETITKAGAERIDGLNKEIKRLVSQGQVDRKAIDDANTVIDTYKKANAEYAEERDAFRSQAAELSNQLAQSEFKLESEHEAAALLKTIDRKLEPVAEIKQIYKQMEAARIEVGKATKAMTDVSSSVLSLTDHIKRKRNDGSK